MVGGDREDGLIDCSSLGQLLDSLGMQRNVMIAVMDKSFSEDIPATERSHPIGSQISVSRILKAEMTNEMEMNKQTTTTTHHTPTVT